MRRDDEQRERLLHALRMDLGGRIQEFLNSPDCEDVVLNEDAKLWAKTALGWQHFGEMGDAEATAIITTVAKLRGLEVGHANPKLETILPTDGNRFEGMLPPVVRLPIFAIRTRAKQVYTLTQYVQQQVLTKVQADLLCKAVSDGSNILVSGGTGSGKTTLLNALLAELARVGNHERVVLIEDTPELQCQSSNHAALLANDQFSMNDCLRTAMRLIPTRVIVGEVRGPEALTMLKAFNTGHRGGMCTVHANSATDALRRLRSLVQEAVPGLDATDLIHDAISLVVHIQGGPPRRVSEIASPLLVRQGGFSIREVS